MKTTLALLSTGLFLLLSHAVFAQETRASISGRAVDSQEAVIPGAKVTATNKATGLAVSAVSNEVGNYRLEYLLPGSYELSISSSGFKTAKRDIELRVGDRLQVDFSLEVGEVTESITVTTATPVLETANANLGQVIDSRRLTTIPLPQGNPTFLLALAAGANPVGTTAFMWDEPIYQSSSDHKFHGGPSAQMSFSLDGISNSLAEFGGVSAANVNPPPDAIEEFRISHAYDATQGHNAGVSVDVALKSGTNSLHGSGYGFFRDSDLDANTFFNNRAGSPKPSSTYRRIGGTVNGPVYLPRIYDGRKRTFFAFTYENTYQMTGEFYGALTVPTADQLKGDFSSLLKLGSQYQIYDPLTTRATGDGFYRRDPIPNNVVPANRIHPVSQQLMQYWPTPNLAGGSDGSLNFQPSTSSPTEWYQTYVRIDHAFTPDHRIFGRYGIVDSYGEWSDFYGTLASGFRQTITKQNIGIDDVYVASPNLVLNFQYGYNRAYDPRKHKSHGKFDITTLDLAPNLISQLDLGQNSLPHVAIAGHNGIHDNTRNNLDVADTHSARVQADHNRKSHNLKLGFEYRAIRQNRADNTFVMPSYSFGNAFTSGPLNVSPAAPLGQGLAAFLLGQPTGGSIWRRDNQASKNSYYGAHFQDYWRVNSNLTVNFGLRYEYYGPVKERYNRSTRGFDFSASSPIEAAARQAYAVNPISEIPVDLFRVRGGYLFAGVGQQPEHLYDAPGKLLAPRFGLTYRLTDRSVLRGGYGLYYVPMGLMGAGGFGPNLAGFSQSTSLVPTLDNGVTFIADIANPFPTGILAPPKASQGLATDLGRSVSFHRTEALKGPHMQRWSLTIQHLLPGNVRLETGYVGSRGTKLIMSRGLNYVPAQYLSTLPYRDEETIRRLGQSVPNPFASLLPGTSLNSNVVSRSQLLLPFPQFSGVTLNHVNDGYSWYHGLETSLERRFARGYSFVVNHTWSKDMEAVSLLNASDPRPYESISSTDRTHIFSFSGIWELPFGPQRQFGVNAPPVLSHVIGGWDISAVWRLMSGFPVGFGNIIFNGDLKNIPLSGNERTVDRWFKTDAGFERSSAKQLASNIRTFPMRLSGVRTDNVNFWDISIIKNNRITEQIRLQFQAQFLNAFNHPSFGGPNTSPTSGSFGRVTSEMTWPRRLMFGVKFLF